MKKTIVLTGIFLLLSCSGKVEDERDATEIVLTELQTKAKALFGELPDLVNNPDNPITEDKIILGQSLYFDPILSKNQTQSCNTCSQSQYFRS